MNDIATFLLESNKIEGVYDSRSLDHALEAWNYLIQQPKLTQTNILETHRILMRSHLTTGGDLGMFRRVDVWVGEHKGLSPWMLADAVHEWIILANTTLSLTNLDNKNKEVRHGIEKSIKMLHVSFEKIHPFIDGNGRMGRILMNWQREKMGLPIITILASERQRYYEWFK